MRLETIASIFAQENQYKVIKTHHVHKANMPQYCSRCVHCLTAHILFCLQLHEEGGVYTRLALQLMLHISGPACIGVMTNPHINSMSMVCSVLPASWLKADAEAHSMACTTSTPCSCSRSSSPVRTPVAHTSICCTLLSTYCQQQPACSAGT